jgi:hypothetical protein
LPATWLQTPWSAYSPEATGARLSRAAAAQQTLIAGVKSNRRTPLATEVLLYHHQPTFFWLTVANSIRKQLYSRGHAVVGMLCVCQIDQPNQPDQLESSTK